MRTSVPIESRFWKYVDRTESCWVWTGATTWGGYGVIQGGGRPSRVVRAHRLSYEMHKGQISDGLDVCHTCDNPPCVNPAHLFLGTAKVNAEDMCAKGRARGPSNLKGVNHPAAKLTEDAVRSIREAYATGTTSYRRLAAQHGVTHKLIIQIVKRRMWPHVD